MKRRFALLAAILATIVAAGPGTAVAQPSSTLALTKTCSHSYTRGVVGGQVKCLRRGEYCAVRYKSQYVRYGFRCYGSPARLH
jgi:hypothetical protein